MQFAQTAAVAQLYVAADNGGPAGTLLYLLPPGAASPPATLSFADAWSTQAGAYLFLEAPLAAGTQAAFCALAWAYLADPRLQGTRFVWFEPPTGSGLLAGTPVAVVQPAGGGAAATAFPAVFTFRSLALTMARGTGVAADAVNDAFVFTPVAAGDVALVAQSGRVVIDGVQGALTVPFTGPLAGCLQFALELDEPDLAALDVGLRYFYALAPTQPPQPGQDFFLDSLRYPVFADGLILYANLDPLAPLQAARSFLAFTASDAGQSAPAATAVASHYVTTLGYRLSLAPLTGADAPTAFAALVLAPRPQASAGSARDPVYLVPRGDFRLAVASGTTVDAMGGLSGVESFAIEGGASRVSFVAGGDAFAPGFAPGQPPGYTSPLQPADAPTTALATLSTPGGQVDYFAQPDQAVLHNTGGEFGPGVTTLAPLAPVAVQAATLAAAPDPAAVFPWLPYGGLAGQDFAPYRQLESQIVSPRRRKVLTAPAVKALANPRRSGVAAVGPYSTTPQGFLASYTGGIATRMDVVLAKMASGAELVLNGVSEHLLAAFQSNKMFLVVSDPASIQAYLSSGARITVGGDAQETWNFALGPDTWASAVRPGTILIFKFYDQPLDQLTTLQSAWSFPAEFNADPAQTAATISGMIQAAQAAPAGDADFAAFLDAATRASWNGVLVLNAEAPLTELPPELAGLAPGIDQARFYAHHIGINASKIITSSGALDIAASSIFGLINYTAQDLTATGDPFAFRVTQLKVLFLNSAVAAFSSVVELEINTLFGEPATLEPAATSDNIVKLYGVYQSHTVAGQEVDTYVFTTAAGVPSVFDMTSGVLNAVQLTQGQFVTVTADSNAATTVAQFLFWGLIDFKALEGFDAFSFGREAGANTPSGLSFSNLVIQMTSDPQTPDTPPVFAFDVSALGLDMAASVARADGVYNHFPLTVNSLTQAKAGSTPQALGFMGVQTPLTQASLVFPWYSLNFNINLGSPGALAAQAGFVATLTVAWAPTTGGPPYSVFTGLSLPGSSGAKRQVSIEGLFNIGFKTLEIIATGTTYILVLYDIGFSFLSFTFPPSGQVNFVLFGDPGAPSGNTSLGWYAAYAKSAAKTPGGGGATRSSKSGQLAAPSARMPAPVEGLP